MSKAKNRPDMVEQLRAAIRASGLSHNELGRRAGITQGQVSRFVSGERTLTLPAAARVCEALGLILTPADAVPGPSPEPARRPRQRKADA